MEDVGQVGIALSDNGGNGEAPADRRRKRDSLFLAGQLTVADDPTAREVRVRNLSEGGLMVETDRVVAPGVAVQLDVRGLGTVTGQIAWCAAGRLGVELDRPIDPRRARKPVGTGAPVPDYVKPVLRAKAPPRR